MVQDLILTLKGDNVEEACSIVLFYLVLVSTA